MKVTASPFYSHVMAIKKAPSKYLPETNLSTLIESIQKEGGEWPLYGYTHFKTFWLFREYLEIWRKMELKQMVLSDAHILKLFSILENDPQRAYKRFFTEFNAYVKKFRKHPVQELVLIGYWNGAGAPDYYPDPKDFESDRPSEDLEALVEYLMNGRSMPYATAGVSECRICGAGLGAGEFTDGTFLWPEGLEHYLMAHNVRLPEVFEQHALSGRPIISEEGVWSGEWAQQKAWWIAQGEKAKAG